MEHIPLPGQDSLSVYNAIYIYDENGTVTVVKAPLRLPTSYSVSGRLLFNDLNEGLLGIIRHETG